MKRRFVLVGLIALTFVGASWPLNPLVTRVSQPSGPVPVGCDEGLAPAATPRVNVAEIPEREVILPVAMPAPPPSRSLREELDASHRALLRNDRLAFDDHLNAARALVSAHPAGSERSRAEEVLWALNDAAVLWDAQFAAPFFDENSDAYTRASRYAGYAEAVRPGVLTDRSEHRFYPAAESRDFIARVAAERLQRLGVRGTANAPSRVARAQAPSSSRTPAVSKPSSSSSRRSTARSSTASAPTSSAAPRRRSSSTPKTRKPAALAKSTSSSSPDPSKAATPAPAEPAPTAPPASVQSTAAPASPVAEEVAPVPVALDTATTTAPPVATSSSTESAPETTTTAAPAEKRSVIVPALLILIGLGVLVVLFRASK